MKVTLLQHTPEPEKLVAAAAKLCYSPSGADEIMEDLTDDNIQGFLKGLMKMGHFSPIEHISFTFGIDGVSRSLSHQLVRHRISSFSQKSQRYVDEGKFTYVTPEKIKDSLLANDIYKGFMNNITQAYNLLYDVLYQENLKMLLDDGIPKDKAPSQAEKLAFEDARYILPNACETNIVVTMNARTLLHFFEVRCCNRAQQEIQELAFEMLNQCKKVAPIIFSKAGPRCLYNDCPEGFMTCGKQKEMRELC